MRNTLRPGERITGMTNNRQMIRKIVMITLCAGGLLLGAAGAASAQTAALKTNLFYAGYTRTPNLGMEFRLGPKSTLDVNVGYNPWNWRGSYEDNKKWVHVLIQPEYRWWTCERFNGHFFGAHLLFSHYNVGGTTVQHFGKGNVFDKEYRYQGYAYGAGVSYGYHLVLSKRWAMEFQLGVGAAYLDHDKYDCAKCGTAYGHESKWYVGLTKANIGLMIYLW